MDFIHIQDLRVFPWLVDASGEYEYSSLKIGALQIGPPKQNGSFLQNGCNDFV
jgi:hypothetical protein